METETGAYIRQSRRNAQTWTVVQVLDLSHPDSEFAPDGGRWAATCVDHGALMACATLAQAISQSADPSSWCADCLERYNHRRGLLRLPVRDW